LPAVAAMTVTDAAGPRAAVTVIVAVPLLPSLVAVIVAVPAVLPVTSPPALTRATVVSLDVQVTVRPVNTVPAESLVVAVSCAVAPTGRLAVAGLTVMEATAAGACATTTIVAESRWLPLAAMTTALPGWVAYTIPELLTVATP